MTASELTIGRGNEGQAQAWDGGEGALWAKHPAFFDTSIRHHQTKLTVGANIAPDERVLDIGCGNGGSTRDAARAATAGTALGIDLSSKMLARARELAAAEGLTNASFVQGDAQVHPFEPSAFDVAISRTGSMFFADQVAAFTNVARALRPGGRLALVSWQGPDRNEWLTSFADALTLGKGMAPPPPDAPTPFAHADPARTTQILTDAGFEDVAIEGVEAPMYFGAHAEEGYAILSEMLGWMTGDLEGADRARALDNLRATLEAHETPEGVAYRSASWLITARRA
jgi:SAM-dependent methyltransferase